MSVIAEQRAELARLLDPNTPVEERPTPEVRTPPDAEHKLLDAAEATDTGQFMALVSDYDFDRTNERFARHAFDNAIAKLQAERRALPVLYGHDQKTATAVIGTCRPKAGEPPTRDCSLRAGSTPNTRCRATSTERSRTGRCNGRSASRSHAAAGCPKADANCKR